MTCPLDCEYLQDARRHDKLVRLDSETIPHEDIRINEKFLQEHVELIQAVGESLFTAALGTAGAADLDMRDALDALVRTYRTLVAGVYYETLPANALASRVFHRVQDDIVRFRAEERRELGMPKTRDADILGTMVFFTRLELDRNNGRPRGRAFISLLQELAEAPANPGGKDSRLVLP